MVNPFSAGTPTLQEAPSFAWRTNGAAPQPPRWSMPNMRSAAGMLGMSSGASSARTAPCPCSAAPRSGVQCVLSSLRDSGPPHYPSEPSRSCHGLTCVVIKSPFVVHGSEARRSTISDVLDARNDEKRIARTLQRTYQNGKALLEGRVHERSMASPLSLALKGLGVIPRWTSRPQNSEQTF